MGAAIAKLRHELAELMPRVRHRNGSAPSGTRLPAAAIAAHSSTVWRVTSMPSVRASGLVSFTRRGLSTGVGRCRAKKCSGKRALRVVEGNGGNGSLDVSTACSGRSQVSKPNMGLTLLAQAANRLPPTHAFFF